METFARETRKFLYRWKHNLKRFNASEVLQNLGSKLTNQNKGKFPERSAPFCNVVDFQILL